jgi:hypothetical protein
MPEDFAASRENRVLHPCESKDQEDYAIETSQEHFCIYVSSLNSQIFGRTFYTIAISGDFDYEQDGAEGFNVIGQSLSFWTRNYDAIITINRKNNDETKISSFSVKISGQKFSSENCPVHCGLQNDAIPVISGGTQAARGAWPWNAGE